MVKVRCGVDLMLLSVWWTGKEMNGKCTKKHRVNSLIRVKNYYGVIIKPAFLKQSQHFANVLVDVTYCSIVRVTLVASNPTWHRVVWSIGIRGPVCKHNIQLVAPRY